MTEAPATAPDARFRRLAGALHSPEVVLRWPRKGAGMLSGDEDGEGLSDVTGVPQPGDVVAGEFLVEHPLGRGGFGTVVAARDLARGTRVAIKFLSSARRHDPEGAARLMREARTAATLSSEHAIRVMRVDRLPAGVPYVVMELLEGTDLAIVVRRRGALPVREAVGYVLQACNAVSEAHALGIVHRDLKTANLFLTRRLDGTPLVKVLDFGLAKPPKRRARNVPERSLTKAGIPMGSPASMSPEQVRSAKEVDARSDIWSIGVVLYELLAGRPPFVSENVWELYSQILLAPVPALSQWRRDLPPGLEQVVMTCLERDPSRRPQTVETLESALEPFAMPTSTAEPVGLPVAAARVLTDHASSLSAASPVLRRRAAARFAAIAVAVLVTAAGAASYLGRAYWSSPVRSQPVSGADAGSGAPAGDVAASGRALAAPASGPAGGDAGVETLEHARPLAGARRADELDEREIAWLLASARRAAEAQHFVLPWTNSMGDLLARLRELDPPNEEAAALRRSALARLHQLASTAVSNGTLAKATNAYRQILQLAPDDQVAWEALGRLPPGSDMVFVPAGTFRMGNATAASGQRYNLPQRASVAAFEIDKYEVTAAQYAACVAAGRCSKPDTGRIDTADVVWDICVHQGRCKKPYRVGICNYGLKERAQHPINCVDWYQAKAYCEWAGKRLPTNAEWEKAARGVDGREYPWGSDNPTCERAVMDDGGRGCGRSSTWPVGSKLLGASPYGAMDMAGNVDEWVADWFFYGPNPRGRTRVTRGGGWASDVGYKHLRADGGFGEWPSFRKSDRGFRCARSRSR